MPVPGPRMRLREAPDGTLMNVSPPPLPRPRLPAHKPGGVCARAPSGIVSIMPMPDSDIIAGLRLCDDLPEPTLEDRPTTISRCPTYIRWLIELLARHAGKTQERAFTYCVARGTMILFSFPGIEQIRSAREHVLECCADSEDMAWFSRCSVDISALDTGSGRFQARIPAMVRSQYAKLADILGLQVGQVAVLATMAVLIDGDFVSARYKVAMRDTLVAFRRKLERRAVRALEIQVRTQPVKIVNITLQDVFDAD